MTSPVSPCRPLGTSTATTQASRSMVSISSRRRCRRCGRVEAGAEQRIDHQGSAVEQAGRRRRDRALHASAAQAASPRNALPRAEQRRARPASPPPGGAAPPRSRRRHCCRVRTARATGCRPIAFASQRRRRPCPPSPSATVPAMPAAMAAASARGHLRAGQKDELGVGVSSRTSAHGERGDWGGRPELNRRHPESQSGALTN